MDTANADIVNATFELGAGIILWFHVKTILKEKKVLGVSIVPFAFFTLWGLWNLYYYPTLGQPWSFWGGIFVVSVNALYTYLLFHYRVLVPRREKHAKSL